MSYRFFHIFFLLPFLLFKPALAGQSQEAFLEKFNQINNEISDLKFEQASLSALFAAEALEISYEEMSELLTQLHSDSASLNGKLLALYLVKHDLLNNRPSTAPLLNAIDQNIWEVGTLTLNASIAPRRLKKAMDDHFRSKHRMTIMLPQLYGLVGIVLSTSALSSFIRHTNTPLDLLQILAGTGLIAYQFPKALAAHKEVVEEISAVAKKVKSYEKLLTVFYTAYSNEMWRQGFEADPIPEDMPLWLKNLRKNLDQAIEARRLCEAKLTEPKLLNL